jgi:hypothetical protein
LEDGTLSPPLDECAGSEEPEALGHEKEFSNAILKSVSKSV